MVSLILLVVGAILVVLIFLLVKIKYIKHKFTWVVIILLAIFFYVSFMLSIAGQGLDLNSAEGIQSAGKVYFSWLGNAFGNMKTLTTNAISDYDWNINASIMGK